VPFGGNSINKPYLDLLLALGWLAGIITQQLLAAPVDYLPLYALVGILGWGCWRSRRLWRGAAMLLVLAWAMGLLWAGHAAQQTVSARLDESLNRQRCVIQGRIQQVDRQTDALTRFVFAVDQLECQGILQPQISRLRLSWYRPQESLRPGEIWQMSVRLKRPHGFSNPGLFDYSAWLAQRHIGATGYVDTATPPVRLATGGLSLNAGRMKLRDGLQNALHGHSQTAVIAALALGERGGISDEQWRVIRTSGTSHLLAISGLHIGLVGAFFWWSMWGRDWR
jgi:competence protein ComEC